MLYSSTFKINAVKEQVRIVKGISTSNFCDNKQHLHVRKEIRSHTNQKLKNGKNFSVQKTIACLQRCDQKPIIHEKTEVDQQIISLRPGLSQVQLEQCVTQVVQDLNNAPLIQAVSTCPILQLRHLHVSEKTLSSPFVWFEIQSQLQNFDPEMLILVNQVDSPVPKCLYRSQYENKQFKMIPGCTFGIRNQQSAFQTSKQKTNLVHGKLGDCCDDDDNFNHTTNLQAQRREYEWVQKLGQGQEYSSNLNQISSDQKNFNQSTKFENLNMSDDCSGDESIKKEACHSQFVKYWGVVIQSKEMSLMDGCYLLTTTQNRGQHGCTCTHFHLTRICQGVSLDHQCRNSWLGQHFSTREFQIQ
eukprot:TRINITY_DN31128_c0_g1_i2.p2 TRINITY_DN31128_c0_g1~~TRINITY_DN31128_c0_g1_i2.p2  ORF type:complete len:358 (-),score=18.20 TRINITY_DN31128_c0_g1_i2:360-1433(-)